MAAEAVEMYSVDAATARAAVPDVALACARMPETKDDSLRASHVSFSRGASAQPHHSAAAPADVDPQLRQRSADGVVAGGVPEAPHTPLAMYPRQSVFS